MKTHSIEWFPVNSRSRNVVLDPSRQLSGLLALASRAFLALVPALAIIVGAAWLVTQPNLVIYLQALTWAAGFIFLGLAIESESAERFILNAATGVALPLLALLSSSIALELIIVAAALVAAWVAAAILQR